MATRHQEHGDQALAAAHSRATTVAHLVAYGHRAVTGIMAAVGAYPLAPGARRPPRRSWSAAARSRCAGPAGCWPPARRCGGRAGGAARAGGTVGVAVSLRGYADGDLDGAWVVHACTDDPGRERGGGGRGRAAADAVRAGRRRGRRLGPDPGRDPGGRPGRRGRLGRRAATPAGRRRVRDAVALLLETGELPLRPGRPGRRLGRAGRRRAGRPGADHRPGPAAAGRGRRRRASTGWPRGCCSTGSPGRRGGRRRQGRRTAPGRPRREISALLVDRARAGKRVVRLKGGDPFVLGRGGEEVAACVAAGVPVDGRARGELGDSPARPRPASRSPTAGVAADFAVVSGHVEPAPDRAPGESSGSVIDWQALADGPATLVLLMALDRLGAAAAELVKRGRPGSTPVAVVRRATLPDQQVLVGDAGHGRGGGRRRRSAPAGGGRRGRGRWSARPALGRLAAGLTWALTCAFESVRRSWRDTPRCRCGPAGSLDSLVVFEHQFERRSRRAARPSTPAPPGGQPVVLPTTQSHRRRRRSADAFGPHGPRGAGRGRAYGRRPRDVPAAGPALRGALGAGPLARARRLALVRPRPARRRAGRSRRRDGGDPLGPGRARACL